MRKFLIVILPIYITVMVPLKLEAASPPAYKIVQMGCNKGKGTCGYAPTKLFKAGSITGLKPRNKPSLEEAQLVTYVRL